MKSIKELLEFYWEYDDNLYFQYRIKDNDRVNARRVLMADGDRGIARRVIMALRGLNTNDFGTAVFPLDITWC